MTLSLTILGLVVAAGATYIGYLALTVSRQMRQDAHFERDRADVHDQLKWINTLVVEVRRLQGAQGAPHPDDFHDIQMSMRVALAVAALRSRLPVTTILSERAFDADAANGMPGWQPFLQTIEAALTELTRVASAIADHELRP
jgi:hypothetical protein